MAPTPQEEAIPEKMFNGERTRPATGEEVVITGMSGIFPSSDSTEQFMENLFNQVNMVNDENPRWVFNHPEVSNYLGKVQGVGKFDAQFFRVHFKQALTMEPMSRKLLEHAYSAIFDAGYNPLQLRGKRIGVFIGSTSSESERIVIYENVQRNGFGITGCNKAMYANRISYWIDGKGPSYAVDLACASSMACFEHAYRRISTGECDAAIVGGCNLCMQPCISLNLRRAGFLSLDGKTRSFDKHGDGYVRADAISVLFLQKAKDAKRIYSEVYHAKANYALKRDALFKPIRESKDIEDFLNSFYSEIDVSPSEVEYIEANGSGIAEADGNELQAIGKIFGKEKPIKVGSVKSNMGNSEPASGACSLTKVCLAYHKGEIPGNLHFKTPQDHIPSVREGRIEVVQKNSPFNRGFTALNCFSYSGANIHMLLKGRCKQKNLEKYKSAIPYLVLGSGRQEHCVNMILDSMKTKPIDAEQIRLLHSIHESEIPGHMCRGYTLIETGEENQTVCHVQNADYFSGITPPVWFVYSGMGSQWAGMGTDLMKIPTFAAAIHKCHKILEPKGIDLIHILTAPDSEIYDNILNSFVGIAAVQIGLTDTLKELGIVPDNIVGHSVGELGCAYADGCFTAEEMILAAYSRGLVSVQTPFIHGSMAAVGLGFKTVQGLVPPEIEVACHNSSESSTISGPAEIMKTFVADLTSRGVFAKEVPCSNIAYHSRYIAEAGPGLLKYLTEVIQNPKERSKKWLSTSVPQDEWEEPQAKYSSAEYHTNNLLKSVLFEETSKLIPAGAMLIEIAPHGLLQAILKRSHPECIHMPLTRRAHPNPVNFFLESIGKLYQQGLVPKVEKLYPKVEFPVATGTPMLSHLVGWEHSEDWPQARYNHKLRFISAAQEFVMSIHDEDYKYMQGHVRDGQTVLPESALLVLVWETLAMHRGFNYRDMPVVFKSVYFFGEASLKTEEPFRLTIMIEKGDNKFEVTHEEVPIASGFVIPVQSAEIAARTLDQPESTKDEIVLNSDDIYRILHLRGYYYKGLFRSIHNSNSNYDQGKIKWSNEWIAFLDALVQFNALSRSHGGVSRPRFLRKLTIDTDVHKKEMETVDETFPLFDVQMYKIYGISRCAGVEIDGMEFFDKPITDEEPDVLATGSFIPHYLTGDVDVETAVLLNLQVLAENIAIPEIKITEIISGISPILSEVIDSVLSKIPIANFKVNAVKGNEVTLDQIDEINKSNVLIVENLLVNEQKMNDLHRALHKNMFVIAIESSISQVHPKYKLFNVITALSVQGRIVILLNKADVAQDENITYIPVTQESKFSWVSNVQSEISKTRRVVLVSDKQPSSGLLGLIKKLSKEYPNKIGIVAVDDYNAPSFNPKSNIYKDQLQKNLIFNIMKNGKWGGFYYLPSAKSIKLNNAKLVSEVPGNMDRLVWVESASVLSSTKDTVQVHYAASSFRDAQKAAGKIKGENYFGMDFSGINNRGQKVMGLLPEGAISSTVEADPDLLWPVPEHWSMEDAATVPLPYIHAFYLLTRHKMDKGSSVFITGGAGALGQAVITICLALDCPVYTSVGDISKKKFLMRIFPQLRAKDITCSRQEDFYETILTTTQGKGCNIVINCLNGAFRKAAMKCSSHCSLFYDISNTDMEDNKDFGMYFLTAEKNYVAMDVANLFKPENFEDRKRLQKIFAEGIAAGWVKPISRVTYAPSDVTRAFRLLSSSKHRGRVLIKLVEPANSNQKITVKPRVTYSSDMTYVVVCGDNDLGIELIDRLISKGARKLVVYLKQKSLDGYFYIKLLSWKKLNVDLRITSENLQTVASCSNLLKEANKLGAIDGIYIVQNTETTSNVLKEDEITVKFEETALVVANLDHIARQICNELRHFVVLSCSSGTPTDEYLSSFSQKICLTRNEMGLPALIYHVKLLDEFNSEHDLSANAKSQKFTQIFNALEISLKLNHNDIISFNMTKKQDKNFSRQISKILGVNSVNDIPEDLTIDELGLNDTVIEELINFLKETIDDIYSDVRVKNLTVASLKNLDPAKSAHEKSKFDSGLGAFYTFIDEDECEATEPMVAMPTKLSNATEKEEELDPKENYVLLIPGFEGHYQKFVPICERLKLHALTFQLGPDITNESIPKMALNIMTFIKKRVELKSKFYLLGYSFGVNVALEVAALMEKEGRVGVVYCLDSSPDALRVQLDAYIGDESESQLENIIIEHTYKLMTGEDCNEIKQQWETLEKWSDKVSACLLRLRGVVHYSHEYKQSLFESAYRRIQLARSYKPNFKLQSEIVLMKGIPHPKAKPLPQDYNLSMYTEQPVKVFNLENDHALAPFDCRVSNIINSVFEPKILEDFKKRNLCETYLSNLFKML